MSTNQETDKIMFHIDKRINEELDNSKDIEMMLNEISFSGTSPINL
jgi:hypothetical protein